MKQYKQKVIATASAILMALTLVGLNTDQAIAQGKSSKGAKVRAGSDAKIKSGRKKVAGAEAFSIDIGTSENLTEKRRLKTANRKRR